MGLHVLSIVEWSYGKTEGNCVGNVQSNQWNICLAFITEMKVAVCRIFSVGPAYGPRNILRLGCISDVSAILTVFILKEKE
jgi:hypothetical protein